MIEEVLYTEPRLILYHDLLTSEECDQILNQDLNFNEATTFNHESKAPQQVSGRSNSTCFDIKEYDSFVKNKILSAIQHNYTDLTVENFEILQVQKYQPGQEYGKHHDYFNFPHIHNTDNDRIGTVIVYLNDDFEGGETDFPKMGFKVRAKKGMAVLFDYQYHFDINDKTLHAGCPLINGTKYVITAWFHRKSFWGM